MKGDDDEVFTYINHIYLLVILDLRGYVEGRLHNMGRSITTLRSPKSIPNNRRQQRELHFGTKRAKSKPTTIQYE